MSAMGTNSSASATLLLRSGSDLLRLQHRNEVAVVAVRLRTHFDGHGEGRRRLPTARVGMVHTRDSRLK